MQTHSVFYARRYRISAPLAWHEAQDLWSRLDDARLLRAAESGDWYATRHRFFEVRASADPAFRALPCIRRAFPSFEGLRARLA